MIEEKASVSALYWFPRVQAAGLPVPKTVFVPVKDYVDMMHLFDGDEPESWADLCSRIDTAAAEIGEPCFLRTDIGSAKHSGPRAYRFPGVKAKNRFDPIVKTIEDHECKHMFGPDVSALMLREFLDLESPFSAFGGLPISREWRIFADAERVHCAHFYWPESSIDDCFWDVPEPADWRLKLRELQQAPPELEELKRMAIAAAAACGEFPWSVDFARTSDGRWFLIDMAPMHQSWHWDDCHNNPHGDE